jgi:hypothetical protein
MAVIATISRRSVDLRLSFFKSSSLTAVNSARRRLIERILSSVERDLEKSEPKKRRIDSCKGINAVLLFL